jgi:hypothetical protein
MALIDCHGHTADQEMHPWHAAQICEPPTC